MTSDLGLASFVDFSYSRGPPGVWTLAFTSGLAVATSQVSITTLVFDMVLSSLTTASNAAPVTFTPGVPLSVQPVVQLISKRGKPVAGRTVVAFASQVRSAGELVPGFNTLCYTLF